MCEHHLFLNEAQGSPPMTSGAGVVSLQLVKGLAISRTIKHMESTSARSTHYGSGHLIRVFHDIGHIFSSLYPFIGGSVS